MDGISLWFADWILRLGFRLVAFFLNERGVSLNVPETYAIEWIRWLMTFNSCTHCCCHPPSFTLYVPWWIEQLLLQIQTFTDTETSQSVSRRASSTCIMCGTYGACLSVASDIYVHTVSVYSVITHASKHHPVYRLYSTDPETWNALKPGTPIAFGHIVFTLPIGIYLHWKKYTTSWTW